MAQTSDLQLPGPRGKPEIEFRPSGGAEASSSGWICRFCSSFPSAGGKPISYCLHCRGKMAPLVSVSGLSRNNAPVQEWPRTANGCLLLEFPCTPSARGGVEAAHRPGLLLHRTILCSRWGGETDLCGECPPELSHSGDCCHVQGNSAVLGCKTKPCLI